MTYSHKIRRYMNPSFNHEIWHNDSHHSNNSIMFSVWWRTQRKEWRQIMSWVDNLSLPKKKENTKKLCVMVAGQHSAPTTTTSAGEKTHSEDKEWLCKRCARVVKTFFSSHQSSWIPHQSYFVSNNRTPMEFFWCYADGPEQTNTKTKPM